MEKPITSLGVPPNKRDIYEALFVFVDNVLCKYKPSTTDTEENKITQDIEISLNDETRVKDVPFAFQNQREDGRYSTDIGVYIRSNRYFFCCIEAKRLPTPIGNDRDEREYVIVDKSNKRFKGNGGIQRFKEGRHASSFEYSIMIGYMQDDNNADYWLSRINLWITELANADGVFWKHEDCLKKIERSKCDRLLSVHGRKDKMPITLHHYWIKV